MTGELTAQSREYGNEHEGGPGLAHVLEGVYKGTFEKRKKDAEGEARFKRIRERTEKKSTTLFIKQPKEGGEAGQIGRTQTEKMSEGGNLHMKKRPPHFMG